MRMIVFEERPEPVAKRIATPAWNCAPAIQSEPVKILSCLQRLLQNLMWNCGLGLVGLRYVPTFCTRRWTSYILYAKMILLSLWITTYYSRISCTLYLVESYRFIFNFYRCTVHYGVYIVHSPTIAPFIKLGEVELYTRIHIIIAPTCFGLRPSSGSLYRAWLKLPFCYNIQ